MPIHIENAREHNLKAVSLTLPTGKLVGITGPSGCGKSSLIMGVVHQEAQRRYLEYLSADLRKSLARLTRPDVDSITGLTPTIAVDDSLLASGRRTTLSTFCDLYDLLAAIYSKLGKQYSPKSGKRLECHTRHEMVALITERFPLGSRLEIAATIDPASFGIAPAIETLRSQGFIRFYVAGELVDDDTDLSTLPEKPFEVIVDRIILKEGIQERLLASVESTLALSGGRLLLLEGRERTRHHFSEEYWCAESGQPYRHLTPRDFSFNSLNSACPDCQGEGGSCRTCNGERLLPQARHVRIEGQNISQLCQQSIAEVSELLDSWQFPGQEAIAEELLTPLRNRLQLLMRAGLSYLPLDRSTKKMSTGERRRLQLAALLGVELSGVTYLFDEPSLGLHRADLPLLSSLFQELLEKGNNIFLIEHDLTLLEQCDWLIELGPGSGRQGGELIQEGTADELQTSSLSRTGSWLQDPLQLPKPPKRKKAENWFSGGAVTFPLERLTAVVGLSGSGKSALMEELSEREILPRLVYSQQEPSRLNARSMPATYTGIMNELRSHYAQTAFARAKGWRAGRFSLNRKGGRCEACKGLGYHDVDLHLLPDLQVPCTLCQGRRYSPDTLLVNWNGKNLAEVLEMDAEKALTHFQKVPQLARRLKTLIKVGLGYLPLGQPSPTLSQGERQRLQLAADLMRPATEPTLYLLDTPSTGLHMEDLKPLVALLHGLVDRGHTVVIAEQRLQLILQADWILEVGPGAGPQGGRVVYSGKREQLEKQSTATGKAVRELLTH